MTTPSTCSIKVLPQEQWISAAAKAIEINPANAPAVHLLGLAAPGAVIPPERLAVLTAKYWGSGGVRLTVGFLDIVRNRLNRTIDTVAPKGWRRMGHQPLTRIILQRQNNSGQSQCDGISFPYRN